MITAKKAMSKFVILISSILILVFGNFQVRGDVAYTSPSYEKQLPIEIKNGTFYRGGRPIFFSGFTKEVTIVEPSRQGGDWEGSSHRIYSGKIDRELMDEFGFNTYQMWGTFGWHFLNKFFPGYIDAETRKFYEERLQAQKLISKEIVQCASIQDFMLNAWVFNKGYNKIKHLIPLDAFQTNSEWDDFFKFDPSNPVGREYYRADYKEYTRFILENGSNPFIYEILNEPFYHSFSKENLSNFKSWVKSRYTNIENANKQWGSHFKNIEESVTLIEAQKAITDSIEPGLWVEWMDFMSDILSQHLKGFKNDILSVDKRPVSKYFTVQPSGIPNIHHKYSAFDYTKLMEWFDVMTIEYGGLSYGGTQSKEEDDPYALGLNISRVESILNMDLARAIAHGKPVCDNEMACRRLESMVRVPSNNYDLGTSLWEQVIHGISSSLIYTWGSRS